MPSPCNLPAGRKPHSAALLPIVAALLCTGALVASAAADPVITLFRVKGGVSTSARALNNNGMVTGEFYNEHDPNHPDRAVGYQRTPDGKIVRFDHQHAAQFRPVAINDAGQIVGTFYHSLDHYLGLSFIYSAGTFEAFHVPHAIETDASAINNNGVVAGHYIEKFTGLDHGFIRAADGTFTTFDVRGKSFRPTFFVNQINDNGDVAGYYGSDSAPIFGFVRTADGKFANIDEPHAGHSDTSQGTLVHAINAAGVIAGEYYDSQYLGHGFIRTANRKYIEFDPPGWGGDTQVTHISNNGDVAGQFADVNGVYRTFIRDSSGKFTVFDAKPKNLEFATVDGFNDLGVVAGTTCNGFTSTTKCEGFIRTP
jgi:hypothetical protein